MPLSNADVLKNPRVFGEEHVPPQLEMENAFVR
jgi:hypothetical protein